MTIAFRPRNGQWLDLRRTVRVAWTCLGTPDLAERVRQAMPDGFEWLPCRQEPVTRARCAPLAPRADLWVIHLDNTIAAQPSDWAGVLHPEQHAPPLTLVLLPPDRGAQMQEWLDAGADRCMPETVELPVLLAMLRALRRRRQGLGASLYEYGPLRFDRETQSLFHAKQRIWLTRRETEVAALFLARGAQPVHSSDILQALGLQDEHRSRAGWVPLYVHRVNRKIRPYGVHINHLRGLGYCLSVDLPAGHAEHADRAWPMHLPWVNQPA